MLFPDLEQPLSLAPRSSVSAAVLALILALASWTLAQNSPAPPSGSSPAPSFGEEQALTVFDNLQSALQSYNRKQFLSLFDSTRMQNFPDFRDHVKNLFDKYDSFTVTYRLTQTAMENANGIALADFGLDGTAASEDGSDLRRHTQLRMVVAWTGKEWKIVDVSPRAVFQ